MLNKYINGIQASQLGVLILTYADSNQLVYIVSSEEMQNASKALRLAASVKKILTPAGHNEKHQESRTFSCR